MKGLNLKKKALAKAVAAAFVCGIALTGQVYALEANSRYFELLQEGIDNNEIMPLAPSSMQEEYYTLNGLVFKEYRGSGGIQENDVTDLTFEGTKAVQFERDCFHFDIGGEYFTTVASSKLFALPNNEFTKWNDFISGRFVEIS